MAVPESNRLALIQSSIEDAQGNVEYLLGTGYLVSNDLILTAAHVLGPLGRRASENGLVRKIGIRLENPPGDGDPWRGAAAAPVWADLILDAALIRLEVPHPEVRDPPQWESSPIDDDSQWASTAYPAAASISAEEGKLVKSSGLGGTLYAQGGGGQGTPELDLGVKDGPKKASDWQGISGAPIFVGDKMVGLVKSVPEDFAGNRIAGLPIGLLLANPSFLAAIAPTPDWGPPFPDTTWCLLLRPDDANKSLGKQIEQSIKKCERKIRVAAGEALRDLENDIEIREVNVTDVLKSPQTWLQFLPAICSAPVMVVDATKCQPALMMLLGIRAVVRRGVTVMVTSELYNEKLIDKLPFNIKESRLVFSRQNIKDREHPSEIIGPTIAEGLEQLRSDPAYLDLPAYDAVRCPAPIERVDEPKIEETAFVLCSFHPNYNDNWTKISNVLVGYKQELYRISDMASPRLVGQGLYERIRWTPCCVVDWTYWRPNVFFEFGARLACSRIGPVSLIDEGKIKSGANCSVKQRNLLMKLFKPTKYRSAEDAPTDALEGALEQFEDRIAGDAPKHDPSILGHDATYRMVAEAYDWQQERISMAPHSDLKSTAEAQFGSDWQKSGESPVLYSTNSEFARDLRRSVRERWIAAWLYLFNRNLEPADDGAAGDTLSRFRRDEVLRKELVDLGETVAQVLKDSDDRDHKRLREMIMEIVIELE